MNQTGERGKRERERGIKSERTERERERDKRAKAI